MGIREISGAALIENSIISPHQSRMVVNLNDKYVTYSELDSLMDPNIRVTRGWGFIKYDKPSKFRNPRFPYIIGTDLLGFKVRVSGVRHFMALSKELPEFAWIVRNTNFTPAYFKLAKMHVGIQIPFSMNAGAYAAKVYDDARARGLDTTNLESGVFVSYRCSQAREKEYTQKATPPRSKVQCAAAFRKAEALAGKEKEGGTEL